MAKERLEYNYVILIIDLCSIDIEADKTPFFSEGGILSLSMWMIRYATLIGILVAFFCATPNAMSETQDAPLTQFPIHHIIAKKQSDLPKDFEKARFDYLSNQTAVNRSWLFRYWKIDDIVEYKDGWLVSADKGEWGGILYWLSRRGELEILVKDNNNPSDMVLFDDSVFITWKPYLPQASGHSDLIRARKVNGVVTLDKFEVPGRVIGFEKRNQDLVVKSTVLKIDNRTNYNIEESFYSLNDILNTYTSWNVGKPKLH